MRCAVELGNDGECNAEMVSCRSICDVVVTLRDEVARGEMVCFARRGVLMGESSSAKGETQEVQEEKRWSRCAVHGRGVISLGGA